MTTQEQFFDAVKAGDRTTVDRLLDENPGLANLKLQSGETPVIAALYRGHSPVVEKLLRAGAPLDVFAAAALGRIDALDETLASDPDAVHRYAYDGWTPLHLAAFFGQTESARRLLGAGARLDAESRNSNRNTPLHAATAGRHAELALMLIERGAPVGGPDGGGQTPLHIAAENGMLDVVKALLARGADPHAVDAEDQTPMSRAAKKNHSAVIDALNLGG
jgi:ankyrin repeat protein